VIAGAVFGWLSIRSDATGQVGRYLGGFLRHAFGQGADVPLLVLFWWGWQQLLSKDKAKRMWTRALGMICLVWVFLTMLHLRLESIALLETLSSQELFWMGRQGMGGGSLGALGCVLVFHFFGRHGARVFLAFAAFLGLVLVTDTSPSQLIGKLTAGLRTMGAWVAQVFRRHRRERQSAPAPAPRPKASAARVVPSGDEEPEAPQTALPQKEPKATVQTGGPFPSLDLLDDYGGSRKARRGQKNVDQRDLLERTLESFGVPAKVVQVCQGPVITRYEVEPPPGIKVSRIVSLADDIALSLAAVGVRIEAPVPGKSVVGIEVPNKERSPVYLKEVLQSAAFIDSPSKVTIALGKDIAGNAVVTSLEKLPHLLIAGATGSGKSVCLNSIIASLLFKAGPDEVKLLMIDPKRVELAVYEGIPHLFCPVVTSPKKAATALRWMVGEMENRYKLFAAAGVRNIESYNQLADEEPLPLMVVIIDELADLMLVAAGDVEEAVCRLAQMARAAGIYLIIATQRPSVDVITGLIKANIPSRIAFAVSSQVDSRTILDMVGAERLLGKGDMLFYPVGMSKPLRVQGAFISDKDVEKLIEWWKGRAEPEYIPDVLEEDEGAYGQAIMDDELFPDAVRLVVEIGQASVSMLQRRFRIGYTRAARLVDMMEMRGVVGGYQGSKPREVLISQEEAEELLAEEKETVG
jgi:S-DNA-T family DNA segregation ATPase FtsK/SpoIIIE